MLRDKENTFLGDGVRKTNAYSREAKIFVFMFLYRWLFFI